MSLPPGPQAPPLLQTWQWLRRPTELLDTCAARYGAIFSLHIVGMGKLVVVAEPEAVRSLFAAGPQVLCQPRNARFLAALGPSSLLLLNGDDHLRHRRLLLPILRKSHSQPFAAALQHLRDETLDGWPLGRPLPLLPLLQDLTRAVMVRVLLGLDDMDACQALMQLCARAIPHLEAPGMLLPLALQPLLGKRSPWRRALSILREGDRLLYALIAARRKAPNLRQREDLLSQLILARDEKGRPLRDRELRDELFTLLITSHDTTAITLCWTLQELLAEPALLQKLSSEVRAATTGGRIDLVKLSTATLLDATLRESQRLWPVFPILARQLLQPLHVSGYELPAGTRVVLCPYLSHRAADSFPQPRRFLPQRFLSEKPAPLHAYYPFGGGLRRCAGAEPALLEMKLLLATLLTRLELVRPASQPASARPVWRFFSLMPEGGLKVIITRRRAAVELL